jgi:(E)-4-hydroxy-3-methylbut-2-enyl-diphosphate synthase
MGSKGIVASSAALGMLLQEGIGDTIRISLTPEPGGDRTRSDRRAGTAADHGPSHLHAAGRGVPRLRPHHLDHVPGTGATMQDFIREQMPVWRIKYPASRTSRSR